MPAKGKKKKSLTPREQRPVIAKPGRGNVSRDWPLLKARFMAYEWLTYSEMSKVTGIYETQIRHKASENEESWHAERSRIARETEEMAREQQRAIILKQIKPRTEAALTLADLFRAKAAESIGQDGPLKQSDAIAAASEARKIEETIIHRQGKAGQEDEEVDAPASDGLIVIPAKRTAEGWKPSKPRA